MKAAIYKTYGPADVVDVAEVDRPEINDNEVLVKIYASAVTAADWRFRSSIFGPWYMWLAGRMIVGLRAPKNPILGTDFAGRVVSVGAKVTSFKLGDEVFGFAKSTHVEYAAVAEDGVIVRKPARLTYEEAAATPFGALSALVFLRDFAKLQAGQRVLVIGAAGGVGVFAVQLARQLGAEVTGVASTGNLALVHSLGADHVIDYKREDFARSGKTYDLIIDTVGATSFARARAALSADGTFLPLEIGVREMGQALFNGIRGGKKVVVGVSGGSKADLATIADLIAKGAVRPVIDSTYSLTQIADAHRRVESRRKTGAVVVSIDSSRAVRAAA